MNRIRIATIVGARPQFIKAAAVSRAFDEFNQQCTGIQIDELLVHTGQHYDERMSQVFFDELDLQPPIANLGINGGGHGQQTGRMLESLESWLKQHQPDWVLVYGDTNSTLAGALAAAKLHIPVAHVEAGLRSFNRRMPEEINRILTDTMSTLLLCPTQSAVDNLAREGITLGVHLVGDVMLDSTRYHLKRAQKQSDVLQRLELTPNGYYLATVHRAENTDNPERLERIFAALERLTRPVIVPLHPRTEARLPDRFKTGSGALRFIAPLPYLDILLLQRNARIILTDSGGLQKEAYWMGCPCITLREETEWTELIDSGWNRLCGSDPEQIIRSVEGFECQNTKHPMLNLLGDGANDSAGATVAHVLIDKSGEVEAAHLGQAPHTT